MKENKYDDNIFFQKYSQMSRSQQGLVQHFFDTHILSSPFLTCIFPVERFSC